MQLSKRRLREMQKSAQCREEAPGRHTDRIKQAVGEKRLEVDTSPEIIGAFAAASIDRETGP